MEAIIEEVENVEEENFTFTDGSEIQVQEDRLVPEQLRGGFFNIELELVTKH